MNLYDLNKQIYKNATAIDINLATKILINYFVEHNDKFYMLLNHDIRYFTLFHYSKEKNPAKIATEVILIIKELGKLLDVVENELGAVEIWVKREEDEDPIMFYLFPYDRGVVIV